MQGVVIKGMKMPDSCEECFSCSVNWAWYHCIIPQDNTTCLDLENAAGEFLYKHTRHPKCPLLKWKGSE